MSIDVSILSKGEIIYAVENYASLALGESLKVHQSDFDILNNSNIYEFTFVFNCYFKNNKTFIPQEHQVMYTDNKHHKYATVLYDQFPDIPNLPSNDKKIHPIILMAPKIWVSTNINTYVLLSCINEDALDAKKTYPFKVDILNEQGEILVTKNLNSYNENTVIDVKALLNNTIVLSQEVTFFTLVAKGGGNGSTVINTLIQNTKTSSLALEHSLYPAYYSSGNRGRIRKDALNFDAYQGTQ